MQALVRPGEISTRQPCQATSSLGSIEPNLAAIQMSDILFACLLDNIAGHAEQSSCPDALSNLHGATIVHHDHELMGSLEVQCQLAPLCTSVI